MWGLLERKNGIFHPLTPSSASRHFRGTLELASGVLEPSPHLSPGPSLPSPFSPSSQLPTVPQTRRLERSGTAAMMSHPDDATHSRRRPRIAIAQIFQKLEAESERRAQREKALELLKDQDAESLSSLAVSVSPALAERRARRERRAGSVSISRFGQVRFRPRVRLCACVVAREDATRGSEFVASATGVFCGRAADERVRVLNIQWAASCPVPVSSPRQEFAYPS
ncbi:hypothetical protein EW146_g6470 [Bondarzewia mesenterica]|uniref:Uncharacterized protein n=1 Tax=Bondarzewia mesenterica TaxID=1095465 RepID=A0A4S4LNF7_9AGAM|nr:hypothetical protein EW146_g6470 [Bondarzewia mesenterica]